MVIGVSNAMLSAYESSPVGNYDKALMGRYTEDGSFADHLGDISAELNQPLSIDPIRKETVGDSVLDLGRNLMKDVLATGQRSQYMTIQGALDNADQTDVITAVTEADIALQTMTTVTKKFEESVNKMLNMHI